MNQEKRNCQNCKQEFTVEPEDFDFYKKMGVPAPTFCPQCRFQRRLMFRNERVLYKDVCDLCGKDMISVFAPDKPFKVYCSPCWWSDNWDSLASGQEYDPSRNFFEQLREVTLKAPQPNLIISYTTLVNSNYVNHAGNLKNCYLLYNGDFCENVHYSEITNNNKDSMDLTMVGESELCYGDINITKCFKTFFSEDSRDCNNVYFSKNLVGCSDCFGCINLKNKRYYIFNEAHTKEEYEKRLVEFRLDSHKSLEKIKNETYKFWESKPQKFAHERHNFNVSGDYVYESKNAHFMYESRYVEDGKFCQIITTAPAKDVYDYTEWGMGAQRIIECITVGEQADNIKFSSGVWANTMNVEYSIYVVSSSNMFGCSGVRKKQNCILNKQYTPEEYQKLKAKIIEDMDKNPYTDSRGRIFKYGEFLPYDLSFYDYSESTANWYFPLSREKILDNGWKWKDIPLPEYKITMTSEQMADTINEIADTIVTEVFECSDCKRPWRVIKPELDLLRRFNLPLPRKCPNCRYKERHSRINPPQLWDRNCVKCGKQIETSFAPNRPEIVYCEQCYNSEII